MLRKISDVILAATLVTALAAPGWAHADTSSAAATTTTETSADATPVAEDGTMVVPMVKVEIQHRGQVIKSKPQRLDWEEAGSVRLERGDRVHDVTLKVVRSGKKLAITLSYELDGELVIEDFAYDTQARKRKVLRTDGVALAITVTPQAIDDGSPNGRKDKLQGPSDPNDPLAGL